MSDDTETGAVQSDGAAGRDRLLRGLILETAGVDLLLGPGRRRTGRRHQARRRALFQYAVLLAVPADG